MRTNLVEGDHRNEDGSVELVELFGLVVRSRGSSFGEIEMSFGGGDAFCFHKPKRAECPRKIVSEEERKARGGWREGGRGRADEPD